MALKLSLRAGPPLTIGLVLSWHDGICMLCNRPAVLHWFNGKTCHLLEKGIRGCKHRAVGQGHCFRRCCCCYGCVRVFMSGDGELKEPMAQTQCRHSHHGWRSHTYTSTVITWIIFIFYDIVDLENHFRNYQKIRDAISVSGFFY